MDEVIQARGDTTAISKKFVSLGCVFDNIDEISCFKSPRGNIPRTCIGEILLLCI